MKTNFIERKALQTKPDSVPPFGKTYTDYMFELDYNATDGWHNPTIKPVGVTDDHPGALVYHYGQAVFEGMKAYVTHEGDVQLFRPMENFNRLNRSLERMCMPTLPAEQCLVWLKELLELDKDWIFDEPDASLYIRPFVYASEAYLGVKPAKEYKFMIIMLPVGSYFGGEVKIKVEEEYVRAMPGGTGEAKCAGNYAASLLATQNARDNGYNEVLWLDAIKRENVDEIGAMNVFFKINDTLVTPRLNGAILPGITRKSVIKILESWGIKVEERDISIHELVAAYKDGSLKEVFGTGTAAVITPIHQLDYKDTSMRFTYEDPMFGKIKQTLVGIQKGEVEDTFGWIEVL